MRIRKREFVWCTSQARQPKGLCIDASINTNMHIMHSIFPCSTAVQAAGRRCIFWYSESCLIIKRYSITHNDKQAARAQIWAYKLLAQNLQLGSTTETVIKDRAYTQVWQIRICQVQETSSDLRTNSVCSIRICSSSCHVTAHLTVECDLRSNLRQLQQKYGSSKRHTHLVVNRLFHNLTF